MSLKVDPLSRDTIINIIVDTLKKNKQALIFVNAKRSAEKVALDISKFIDKNKSIFNLSFEELEKISERIQSVLERPTVQCLRLAEATKQGVAFHHSGLLPEQRELIENSFRKGLIKVIVATPTLAAGVDLPAYRVVIRDLKRYSKGRLSYIPVMEYMQQAGRAGRPKYDNVGEAIVVVSSNSEREKVLNDYILGIPEDIFSKLAVEPILRTFVLSLIAGGFFRKENELMDFFAKTFWSYQFKDLDKIKFMIQEIAKELIEKSFLVLKDGSYAATDLGKRVAELYLDPLTAYDFIQGLNNISKFEAFPVLVLISKSLELRPLPSVYKREIEDIFALIQENYDDFLFDVPSEFDYDFEDFLRAVKFAALLNDWINEMDEESLLEKYNIRPGELRVKLELVDWLIYALIELAKVLNKNKLINSLFRLRLRLKYGAKEELIPLLQLKGIGKQRARLLYSKGIKNLGDVKKAGFSKLKALLGEKLTLKILEQLNVEVNEELVNKNPKNHEPRKKPVNRNRRESKNNLGNHKQSSLNDF